MRYFEFEAFRVNYISIAICRSIAISYRDQDRFGIHNDLLAQFNLIIEGATNESR